MRKGKSSFGLFFLIIIAIAIFGGNSKKETNSATSSRSISTDNDKPYTATVEIETIGMPTPIPTATPTPTPMPTEVPLLQNGNKGEEVSTLQEYLINYGYLSGIPSGKYDSATVKAVKDFQINNGLKETGKFNEEEWEKITSVRVVYQETVYKSKSGKVYHSYDTCSGMKTAKEMTLSDALRKGLRPCSHCH